MVETNLGVSDEDNLGVGASLVEGGHGLDNSLSSLGSRVVVADSTASGSTATGRVDNGLRASARVCRLDRVDEASSSAVSVALRLSSLTGTENINFWAALPLFKGTGGGEADQESSSSGNLHCDLWFVVVETVK